MNSGIEDNLFNQVKKERFYLMKWCSKHNDEMSLSKKIRKMSD